MITKRIFRVATVLAISAVVGSCNSEPTDQVVIYTALDEMYSRPILDDFERETGITVDVVYDGESSKTTGLVNRLIAESDRPRADVFWNNEVAQTIVLQERGVLQPYKSPSREWIPQQFKDKEGYWTGFAARGRVIIYNTELVKTPPDSIKDLCDPKWRGKAAIAKPLFGTTATHAATLFAAWGDDDTRSFFAELKKNEVAVLPGNATVRDLVARGDYAWGLTDTDDANGALEDGFPVAWVFPDQGEGQCGTLILPNTVALLKGAPNGESGKKLIDYLLSSEVEEKLAASRSKQIPLNTQVDTTEPNLGGIRVYDVSFNEIADQLDQSMRFIQEEFLR